MKKAIIYRRASTNETKQAHSLDNQARMLWSFAEEYGYEVIEEVVEYASASKGERDGFNYVCSLLSKNPDLHLIVNDLTRLSRDIGSWNDWSCYLPRIRFARKGDVSLTELEASLFLVIAANESRVLGQRISEGIQRAKERALEAGETWTWGNPGNPIHARQALMLQTNSWREKIQSICGMLESSGIHTLAAKCEWLTDNGFRTQRGGIIGNATLWRALKTA